jgi:DNA topoisomerase I
MNKIPSKSAKLQADHFLKCQQPGCTSVLFWNQKAQRYQPPYAQRAIDPDTFTEIPCPVCGALLERYRYHKEGQDKVMLRCSLPEHRRGKCREVAFFASREGFWSPTFGSIRQPPTANS